MNILRLLAVTILWLPLVPAACSGAALAKDAGAKPGGYTGTVTETTNAATYTYVQVDTGTKKIWAAAPQFAVKVGDKVTVPEGIPMQNYQSKTLKRTFDVVYFVDTIQVAGSKPAAGQGADPHAGMNIDPHAGMKADPHAGLTMDPHAGLKGRTNVPPPAVLDFKGLTKPAGGLTVAELYAQKAALASKTVTLRGKVVKYNDQIMNRNWVHLQDGTGAKGANDLTITTTNSTQVGDTVLVTGTVVLNKDFGYGYKNELLLENGKITVERKAKP